MTGKLFEWFVTELFTNNSFLESQKKAETKKRESEHQYFVNSTRNFVENFDLVVFTMSAKVEYISPEGLRIDGRRPDELRKIKCKLGVLSRADGSAYLEQGNTKVIVAIYGPREVRLLFRLIFLEFQV